MTRANVGWFLLDRRLFRSWIFENPHHLKMWVWMLGRANWESSKIFWDGKRIALERGQILTSAVEIASECGVNRALVRRFIEKLKISEAIEYVSGQYGCIITIVNYKLYQDKDLPERPESAHVSGQKAATKRPHYNNLTSKQDKETTSPSSSPEDAPVELKISPREMVKIWNAHSGPITKKVKEKTFSAGSTRWLTAQKRLADIPDLAYWESVAKRIAASPFCNGEGSRRWIATFDFFLRPETHIKVMEGVYDAKREKSFEELMNEQAESADAVPGLAF